MKSLLCTLCADAHLGRVELDTLSDQTMMELLIAGFTDQSKARFQDGSGYYLDVCKWEGVECDDAERVVSFWIERTQKNLEGTINPHFGPKTLIRIILREHSLSGTINTSELSRTLKVAEFGTNNFSGTIDLTTLPDVLEEFDIEENKCDGTVSLEALPPQMTILNISSNEFHGTLCFEKLPATMESLYVSNNAFTGSFTFLNVPPALKQLFAFSTQLSGLATVRSSAAPKIVLGMTQIISIVDERGVRLGNAREILRREWV